MQLKPFFDYAQKREAIRIQREHGAPYPWTEDEVLRTYRFCNIFREDDTVTKWVKENLREPHRNNPRVLILMVVARFINKIESLDAVSTYLHDYVGGTHWSFVETEIARELLSLRDDGPIITGAYMVKTPPGLNKVEGLMDIFRPIERQVCKPDNLDTDFTCGGLQLLHKWLMVFPYMGSFMAYEVATDMRHTDFYAEAHDINTWAAIGPGAARGLSRILFENPGVFGYTSKRQQETMLSHMADILEESKKKENWRWQDRPWEMREVEHTLCEFDKYERARLGEGKPKQLLRHTQGESNGDRETE